MITGLRVEGLGLRVGKDSRSPAGGFASRAESVLVITDITEKRLARDAKPQAGEGLPVETTGYFLARLESLCLSNHV